MIELRNVTVTYPQTKPLSDVSCKLLSSVTSIMGPSGSGKSTLLRIVAGLQSPSQGTVRINDEPIAKPTWKSAGDRRVSLIHQNYRLIDFLSVSQNLRLAAELRAIDVGPTDLVDSLATVGLSESYLGRQPASLSGGEQQRVAIARALICNVEVLLADEPTGALDRDNTSRIAEVLRTIGERDGVQVIVATHDPAVAEVATEAYMLVAGEMTQT